jgi:hypothetical protein
MTNQKQPKEKASHSQTMNGLNPKRMPSKGSRARGVLHGAKPWSWFQCGVSQRKAELNQAHRCVPGPPGPKGLGPGTWDQAPGTRRQAPGTPGKISGELHQEAFKMSLHT